MTVSKPGDDMTGDQRSEYAARRRWSGAYLVGDLPSAIAYFHDQLPGWWFSVGSCSVSADATVAPDRSGMDHELLQERGFDEGFDANLPPPATMADALRHATDQAVQARTAFINSFGW